MSFSADAQSLRPVLSLKVKLLRRFPLAADGRHDGTLLLQLGESLVDLLAVGTQCLRHVASRDGLACLAHSL